MSTSHCQSGCFNSLFEMRGSALRRRLESVLLEGFNSLFEMLPTPQGDFVYLLLAFQFSI